MFHSITKFVALSACAIFLIPTHSTYSAPDWITSGRYLGICTYRHNLGPQWVENEDYRVNIDVMILTYDGSNVVYLPTYFHVRGTHPTFYRTHALELVFIEKNGNEEKTIWREKNAFEIYLPSTSTIKHEVAPYFVVPSAIESRAWSSSGIMRLRLYSGNRDDSWNVFDRFSCKRG